MPKATPTNDTTPATAVDPVLYEAPTVEIAGRTYPLRRLGLGDVFSVVRILGRGVAVLGGGEGLHPGQVLQVLIASMTTNEEEVLKLMASLIGVDRKSLDDPARFPPESIITVGKALADHQDLARFLASVQSLVERLPEMQTS